MVDYAGMSMLDIFREEVEQHAGHLLDGLLALEKQPEQTNRLEGLMRAAHSIKGAARIVRIQPAVDLAHVLEEWFVQAQQGTAQLTSEVIDHLLPVIDTLQQIGKQACQPPADWAATLAQIVPPLIARLEQLAQPARQATANATPTTSVAPVVATIAPLVSANDSSMEASATENQINTLPTNLPAWHTSVPDHCTWEQAEHLRQEWVEWLRQATTTTTTTSTATTSQWIGSSTEPQLLTIDLRQVQTLTPASLALLTAIRRQIRQQPLLQPWIHFAVESEQQIWLPFVLYG